MNTIASNAPSGFSASGSAGSFRQETIMAVAQLRSSLSRLVGFDQGGAKRSRELQKRFGVDFQLSWQVYRILNTSNPLESLPHIPLPTAMQRFLAAARRHGAAEEMVIAVEAAYAEMEELVERFAGDRGSFDSMVARLVGGETDMQAELAHRKSIFEGQRYILGVELGTYLTADIFHPCPGDPSKMDYAGLRMKRHFRRLSSDAPLIVERRRFRDHGDSPVVIHPEPLDKAAFDKFGIAVMPAFCSTPSLPLNRTDEADGTRVTKWIGGAVGRPSEIDVAMGEVWRAMPLRSRPQNKWGFTTSTTFSTPTRLFVRDFFMPRSVLGAPGCDVTRWSHAVEFPKRVEPMEEMGLPKLTCNDQLKYVGSGLSAVHAVEVPQYAEMLKYTCQSLGWNLEDMDVYRIRIEFPLIFTLSVMAITFNFNE